MTILTQRRPTLEPLPHVPWVFPPLSLIRPPWWAQDRRFPGWYVGIARPAPNCPVLRGRQPYLQVFPWGGPVHVESAGVAEALSLFSPLHLSGADVLRPRKQLQSYLV